MTQPAPVQFRARAPHARPSTALPSVQFARLSVGMTGSGAWAERLAAKVCPVRRV